MQLRDRIRTESVLRRLSWRLGWGTVPAPQQREVVRELRAGLEDAARSGDLDEALARLGGPRELAEAYLDAMQPRPRWASGILWSGIALALTMLVTLLVATAFSAGVDAGQAGGNRFELWPGSAFDGSALFVEERTADGTRATGAFSLFTPAHLGTMLIAFVAASRPWRALPRRG